MRPKKKKKTSQSSFSFSGGNRRPIHVQNKHILEEKTVNLVVESK